MNAQSVGLNAKIEHLEWDTAYFNIPSCKVTLMDELSAESMCSLIGHLDRYRFCTIMNRGNSASNNLLIGTHMSAFLTDCNLQFTKNIYRQPQDAGGDSSVFTIDRFPRNQQIMEIAEKVFTHSRFLNDPWLEKEKAKGVYVRWCEGAFEKSDRFFTVCMQSQQVGGFILFSIQGATAVMELVATHPAYRGRGIGARLVRQVEQSAANRGATLLQVGTQLNNAQAIRFYQRYGFSYQECTTVYHYWPGNNDY